MCPNSAYLSGEKAELSFDVHHFEFLFEFCLVGDFECFVMPDAESPMIVSMHVQSGFCIYHVLAYEQYRTAIHTYSGKNIMQRFFDHIFEEVNVINNILSYNVP